MSATTDAILRAIENTVRPKLDVDRSLGGYDCCGCSTYEQIVADIEMIIRGQA